MPIDRDADRTRIMAAATAHDMYTVLRADCWVVVHIHSVCRGRGGVEGGMEGTRLTLVRDNSVPDGYEFSIRTPVTPARWALFDQVGASEVVCANVVAEDVGAFAMTAMAMCWVC